MCVSQMFANAQTVNDKPWFVSVCLGEQHSGIRKEDYVSDNFSPLIAIEGGKFVTPYLAISAGYKGMYYKFISDDDKHNYAFFYADLVLDIHNCFGYKEDRIWNAQVYAGGGLMFNKYQYMPTPNGNVYFEDGRTMPAINIGISNLFKVSRNLQLGVDVGGIAGWALFQCDEDMIPSAFARAVYSFR